MNDRAVIEPAEIKGSRLPELIALASEESSEKRRLLLRELTEHFFGVPAPNAVSYTHLTLPTTPYV